MAENIEQKIKSYRTAPFDARFPNTNQTRNCFQNYLGEFRRTPSDRKLLLFLNRCNNLKYQYFNIWIDLKFCNYKSFVCDGSGSCRFV